MPRSRMVFLVIATLLSVAPVSAQPVAEGSHSPAQTSAGSFDGTWFYVNRDVRVALWLRTGADGLPEAKLRLTVIKNAETFETGWDTYADYFLRDIPGVFHVEWTARDPERMEGTWRWELGVDRPTGRAESASIRLYRIEDGRQLAMDFDGWERTFRRDGAIVQRHQVEQVWVFEKASKRLALWDELPF